MLVARCCLGNITRSGCYIESEVNRDTFIAIFKRHTIYRDNNPPSQNGKEFFDVAFRTRCQFTFAQQRHMLMVL